MSATARKSWLGGYSGGRMSAATRRKLSRLLPEGWLQESLRGAQSQNRAAAHKN
jgi:hypothetical protein